jgi:hypothetical protein
MELQDSAKRQGPFALFNCLVLGHTKYNGVQQVYCNPCPAKTFHGSHHLDIVMIRPPGINNGAFVVSPDTIWYAWVLLLFSESAAIDTGSESFECALVSTLETYYDPEQLYHLYLLCVLCFLNRLKHFRLAGICWFPCPILARLQEIYSLHHSY